MRMVLRFFGLPLGGSRILNDKNLLEDSIFQQVLREAFF